MNKTIAIIVSMMLVTYIPRLLPFLFLDIEKLPKRFRLFLRYIPFAALGGLILPGGIYSVNESMPISISGLAVAAITAWFTKNIIISVISSVAYTALLLYLF